MSGTFYPIDILADDGQTTLAKRINLEYWYKPTGGNEVNLGITYDYKDGWRPINSLEDETIIEDRLRSVEDSYDINVRFLGGPIIRWGKSELESHVRTTTHIMSLVSSLPQFEEIIADYFVRR